VRVELALALLALVDELMPLLLQLPDCGLVLGLVLLGLGVHTLPPILYYLPLGPRGRGFHDDPEENTSLWRVCPLALSGGK
jgi:hypothetical protein